MVGNIEPGSTHFTIEKIAPEKGSPIHLLAKSFIRAGNPIIAHPVINGKPSHEIDQTLSGEILDDVYTEKEGRIFRLIMSNRNEYRINILH